MAYRHAVDREGDYTGGAEHTGNHDKEGYSDHSRGGPLTTLAAPKATTIVEPTAVSIVALSIAAPAQLQAQARWK